MPLKSGLWVGGRHGQGGRPRLAIDRWFPVRASHVRGLQ